MSSFRAKGLIKREADGCTLGIGCSVIVYSQPQTVAYVSIDLFDYELFNDIVICSDCETNG